MYHTTFLEFQPLIQAPYLLRKIFELRPRTKKKKKPCFTATDLFFAFHEIFFERERENHTYVFFFVFCFFENTNLTHERSYVMINDTVIAATVLT